MNMSLINQDYNILFELDKQEFRLCKLRLSLASLNEDNNNNDDNLVYTKMINLQCFNKRKKYIKEI